MNKLILNTIQTIYKRRNPNSHKGTHGHALIISGSETKMGAAIICSKACLRSGVGLLTVFVPEKEKNSIFVSIPEAMIVLRENQVDFNKYDSIAIGPGIGITKDSEALLEKIITNYSNPIVFDADAITLLSENKDLLNKIPKKSIFTPHIKEFDRLFGVKNSVEERIETTKQKAKELDCVIVLKSHQTIITDGKQVVQNTTGNSGLAKGGSGDALTGMITSFLAQGYEPFHAAQLGVFIHGLAADLTLEQQSEESMLITDVIENFGLAFKKIQ
ncbi:NAD(P)H-hydrate dehydratase [Flavobacterium capsici]|uniref:ADP-dependent (S)-NAD(P)H-hydrate dehydratase n=1 Tax=Flavobacterium capsici TaxID=3075618 RepID=A0AA96F1T7_9FLAO|nr:MULTISPECIES: NAD(P)H-hydrate dehydratase [unclassified Flavobacterium]WNM19655.1 NAD(P)H-hydrate dehydratase [Flavobacterium sp. PMR2A8]WNM21044.1 NAD(P)H-hydrate dehydratase [Flavobacterium sp. PMTSA4]